MDNHAGRMTIIASSTMVHHRIKCMICGRPVDNRVVFMTNAARVLHAGCVPDHVKVPQAVLLQAIRRLERKRRKLEDAFFDILRAQDPLKQAAAAGSSPSGTAIIELASSENVTK